jgi:hypothetical protein
MEVTQQRPLLEQPDSPLLRLPGELRNRIYEFALTTGPDNPLNLAEPSVRYEDGQLRRRKAYSSTKSRSDSLDNEFNQLKYASRQLYTETAGLELQSSCIRFSGQVVRGTLESGPAATFVSFLRTCSPSKSSWITRVHLQIGGNAKLLHTLLIEEPSHFITIADFCRSHPAVRVSYLIDEPVQMRSLYEAHYYFYMGVFLKIALYHQDVCRLLPDADDWARTWAVADDWATEEQVKSLDVPNLRIGVKGFRVTKASTDKMWTAAFHSGWNKTTFNGCLKHAKRLVRNGF